MHSLHSLYFPETVLPNHQRNTLLLLPDILHFLQAVEHDTPTNSDLFMEKGFCQAYTPSTLGKDRERFIKLMGEIQEQKSTNAEQFSSVTLAHLSEEIQRGDQSHRAIVSSLLAGDTKLRVSGDDDTKAEKLWQSRLVLALAEILDREEAELAEDFSTIDSSEKDLFDALKGELEGSVEDEEENPFTQLTRIRAKLSQQRPGTIKKRFKAWKTMYASGNAAEEFWLWISNNEEAGELLISDYEKTSGRFTVPLLRLNIPEQILMREQDALKSIEHFHLKAAKLREQIADKLYSTVTKGHLNHVDPVVLLPDAGMLSHGWNELIEFYFPEKTYGCRYLDFQFAANVSLDQVCNNGSVAGKYKHSIIAICREQ